MLPEIAAEVLHFLTRRDLDETIGVSKWLDALVAQCCEVYPLRPVRTLALYPCDDSTLEVWVESGWDAGTDSLLFSGISEMDEAVQIAGSILCHSYVEHHQLRAHIYDGPRVALFPNHWTRLMDAMRRGAVQCIQFSDTDLSALDDDSLLAAAGCRGLQSLGVKRSVLPSGAVMDDLLRANVTKGLHQLWISECDTPYAFSEDAVLDLYFPADGSLGQQSLSLELDGSSVSTFFVAKFFERLRSSPIRPSGNLKFYGAAKQSGLSAYASYLTTGGVHGIDAFYRFPSSDNDETFYEVVISELTFYTTMVFHFV